MNASTRRSKARESKIFDYVKKSNKLVRRLEWGHRLLDAVEEETHQRDKALRKRQALHESSAVPLSAQQRYLRKLQSLDFQPAGGKNVTAATNSSKIPQDLSVSQSGEGGAGGSGGVVSDGRVEQLRKILGPDGIPQQPPGTRVMYGSQIALRSHHGRYLSVNLSTGCVSASAISPLEPGAMLTVLQQGNLAGRGGVRYGDSIMLQVSESSVLGTRLSIDVSTERTDSKSAPQRRTEQPMVIPGSTEAGAEHFGRWAVLHPARRHLELGAEVCHLGEVTLEHDWVALGADNDGNAVLSSLPGSLFRPGNSGDMDSTRVSAGSSAQILPQQAVDRKQRWTICVLSASATSERNIPADEMMLYAAQKQLAESRALRAGGAHNFVEGVRVSMANHRTAMDTKYLTTQEVRSDHLQASLSSRYRKAAHRNWHHPTSLQLGELPPSSVMAPGAVPLLGRKQQRTASSSVRRFHREPSVATAAGKRPGSRESTTRRQPGRRVQQQKRQTGERSPTDGTRKDRKRGIYHSMTSIRAQAMASAAEARVGSMVWIELEAEDAKFKQETDAALEMAVLVVQRAFRKWRKGRWQRHFDRITTGINRQLLAERTRETRIKELNHITHGTAAAGVESQLSSVEPVVDEAKRTAFTTQAISAFAGLSSKEDSATVVSSQVASDPALVQTSTSEDNDSVASHTGSSIPRRLNDDEAEQLAMSDMLTARLLSVLPQPPLPRLTLDGGQLVYPSNPSYAAAAAAAAGSVQGSAVTSSNTATATVSQDALPPTAGPPRSVLLSEPSLAAVDDPRWDEIVTGDISATVRDSLSHGVGFPSDSRVRAQANAAADNTTPLPYARPPVVTARDSPLRGAVRSLRALRHSPSPAVTHTAQMGDLDTTIAATPRVTQVEEIPPGEIPPPAFPPSRATASVLQGGPLRDRMQEWREREVETQRARVLQLMGLDQQPSGSLRGPSLWEEQQEHRQVLYGGGGIPAQEGTKKLHSRNILSQNAGADDNNSVCSDAGVAAESQHQQCRNSRLDDTPPAFSVSSEELRLRQAQILLTLHNPAVFGDEPAVHGGTQSAVVAHLQRAMRPSTAASRPASSPSLSSRKRRPRSHLRPTTSVPRSAVSWKYAHYFPELRSDPQLVSRATQPRTRATSAHPLPSKRRQQLATSRSVRPATAAPSGVKGVARASIDNHGDAGWPVPLTKRLGSAAVLRSQVHSQVVAAASQPRATSAGARPLTALHRDRCGPRPSTHHPRANSSGPSNDARARGHRGHGYARSVSATLRDLKLGASRGIPSTAALLNRPPIPHSSTAATIGDTAAFSEVGSAQQMQNSFANVLRSKRSALNQPPDRVRLHSAAISGRRPLSQPARASSAGPRRGAPPLMRFSPGHVDSVDSTANLAGDSFISAMSQSSAVNMPSLRLPASKNAADPAPKGVPLVVASVPTPGARTTVRSRPTTATPTRRIPSSPTSPIQSPQVSKGPNMATIAPSGAGAANRPHTAAPRRKRTSNPIGRATSTQHKVMNPATPEPTSADSPVYTTSVLRTRYKRKPLTKRRRTKQGSRLQRLNDALGVAAQGDASALEAQDANHWEKKPIGRARLA